MSGEIKPEKEAKALDALIVSALRCDDEQGDLDPERLPELSDEEEKKLASLGPAFLRRLLAGEIKPKCSGDISPPPIGERVAISQDHGLVHALNRADDIDSDAASELDRRRKEIIERKTQDRGRTQSGG